MKLSREFLKFVVAGGTAAAVNFLSRIVLNYFLSFEVSVILAYIVGMATAYILTRLFVFHSDASIASSSTKFVIVNIAAVLQTYFVSVYLYRFLQEYSSISYQKELAHFAGISIPVFTSYLGHKYWSFKTTVNYGRN